MWQQLIAGALVIAAAVYAARTLGPRSWRRKRAAGANSADGAACGCGKDKNGNGCH
jgi:hypothetical protein